MINNKPRLFLATAIVLVFNLIGCVKAQDMPGKRDSINSAILNEKRIIQVILPESYKSGYTDKYDVVYVLDDGNIKLGSDMQRFIQSEGGMPAAIIVGIINTDRDKDFLPTRAEGNKTSGSANKFLKFFKDELIPYINKTYPSNGDNTLFGHSFGGVFVTYALLNEPQLFRNYIAADPSYWWDDGIMLKQVRDKLPALANMNKSLFISGREGDGMTGMRITPMDSLLKKVAPAGFNWKVNAYPNETHGSVRLKSFYDGLKFSYAGYSTKAIEFHPSNGIMLKEKPIKLWYFDDVSKVHYTIDGSEPSLTSPQVQPEIVLSAPAKVTLKQFSGRGKYDKTVSGEFKAGSYLPTSPLKKGYKPGGFNYTYYEGTWDKLPDFKTLKPVKEGIADSTFSLDKLPRQNNFAVVIEGQFEVTEPGYYLFGIASDDGAKMYVDNQLLMDNDGLHDANGQKSYILPLQKGFYPIKIEYFQKEGGRSLVFKYITPENIDKKKPTDIPLSLRYGHR